MKKKMKYQVEAKVTDCIPIRDPYHLDTDGVSRTQLTIYTKDRRVEIDQVFDSGSWYHLPAGEYQVTLPEHYHPTLEDITDWVNDNGDLLDDPRTHEVEESLYHYPARVYQLWSASDWIADDADLPGNPGDWSDDDIERITDEYVSAAGEDSGIINVVIPVEIRNYLVNLRREAR